MSKKSSNHAGGKEKHRVTQGNRDLVAIAAGAGMPHTEIAQGLGIARNTLERWYGKELKEGAYARRLLVISAMYHAATGAKPNVTAGKAYMALVPKDVLPKPSRKRKEVPLGKKEQAQVDARSSAHGTDWSDDLPKVGTPLQ